jgi:hypothetical protein
MKNCCVLKSLHKKEKSSPYFQQSNAVSYKTTEYFKWILHYMYDFYLWENLKREIL